MISLVVDFYENVTKFLQGKLFPYWNRDRIHKTVAYTKYQSFFTSVSLWLMFMKEEGIFASKQKIIMSKAPKIIPFG